jgi:hypothetical protein
MNIIRQIAGAGLYAIFLTLLVSCGSDDNGNPLAVPTGPSGTLSASAANSFAAAGVTGEGMAGMSNSLNSTAATSYFVKTSRNQYLQGVERVLGSHFLEGHDGQPRACNPTLSGDQTDADGDHFPKNGTFTYNCNSSSGGLTTTLSGSYTLVDQNDSKPFPAAGFTLTIPNFTFTLGGSGSSNNISFASNGNYGLNVTSSTYVATLAMMTTVSGSGTSGVVKYFLNETVTPDSMSTPTASGSVTAKGFVVVQTNGLNVTVEMDMSSITYNQSCANFFNNGVITFKDAGANTINFTYTNCNLVKTVNGTTVTR